MGGADVAFLVKPAHAAAARAGFDLYPLDRKDPRREPVRLEGVPVLESTDALAAERFDAVLLCTASTALRDERWLEALARASGDATIVVLQPGLEDRDRVVAKAGAERIVSGMIGMVSYPAPLPGERVPRPGIAYWLPPGSETPLSGPEARALPLVESLRRGGIRSRLVPDATRDAALPSAVLGAVVAALEGAGWSWAEARRGDHLALACRAAREIAAVSFARWEARPPLAARLVRPALLRLVMRLAPLVAPLDLETYFRVHFEKVGAQMHEGMRLAIEKGRAMGLAMEAARELARRAEARGKVEGAGAGAGAGGGVGEGGGAGTG
jgi:2-dehydropantoate 2-reductase